MLAQRLFAATRTVRKAAPKKQTRNVSTTRVTEFVEPLSNAALSARTPLNVLPEQVPSPAGILPAAANVSVTSAHGITFVTIDEPKPVTSMSLFVKAGSRYEDATSAGSAHFLKRLAFRSTEKKYFYPLILDVDKAGIEFESAASREFVSYSLTGLRSDQSIMAETLGAVFQPRLEEFELEAVRSEVLSDIAVNATNGRETLLNAVHRAAFRDQGLSHSPLAESFEASSLSGSAIRQFVNTHYVPERMIVVANGASIEEIKSHVDTFEPLDVKTIIADAIGPGLESYFPQLTPAAPIRDAKSVYTGGAEIRLPGSGATQIVVAGEGVGANQGVSAQIAAALLQTIVGGGSAGLYHLLPSFKQSRLAKEVANSTNGYLTYAESFHLSYADAGLFGIFAHAEAGNVARVAETLAKQFQTLSVVSEAEVARAKQQLKLNLYNTFAADAHALAEFYAAQASSSSTSTILTPTQFAAQIDTVDTAAVVAIAKKVAASKLTVAALGDVKGLPKF